MSFSNNIPNIISVSRGIAALAMLRFPAFYIPFWILYCWCGFSDMIDGALARKMNATSELGSRIDTLTDLTFVICSAIKDGSLVLSETYNGYSKSDCCHR